MENIDWAEVGMRLHLWIAGVLLLEGLFQKSGRLPVGRAYELTREKERKSCEGADDSVPVKDDGKEDGSLP